MLIFYIQILMFTFKFYIYIFIWYAIQYSSSQIQ